MKKILKYTAILAIAIIFIVFTASYILITQINPNRFKSLLTSQARNYINYDITIDGDLSWKFFPYLAVKIDHITLRSLPTAQEKMLITINDIDVGVKLRPLLQKKLEIISMDMNGIDISTHNKDESHKNYLIKNVQLHAKDISTARSFPVQMEFDYPAPTLPLEVHVSAEGNVLVDMQKHIYVIDQLNTVSDIEYAKNKTTVKLQGKIKIDTDKQTLAWHDLHGNIANMLVAGTLNVTDLMTNPQAKGHLSIKPFDLKQTLDELKQNTGTVEAAENAKAEFDYTLNKHSFTLQGSSALDKLIINHIQMTHVHLQPQFKNGILDLTPITADLYQGKLRGQCKIDFNGNMPKLSFTTQFNNIATDALLRDFTNKQSKLLLVGTGDMNLRATSMGLQSQAFLRNLNGSGKFAFKNGSLQGIDLDNLISAADAIIKGQTVPSSGDNTTHFNTLTGTITIQNGNLQNKDMALDARQFVTTGEGYIDLVNQQINYLLETRVKKQPTDADALTNLYGIAIPILVTGSLNNPAVKLETGRLLKAVADKQITNARQKAQEVIQNEIKKRLPVPGPALDAIQNLLNN